MIRDNSNARLGREVEWIVALLRYFLTVSPHSRCREIFRKLHLDFGVIRSIGHAMNERRLRELFAEIGCIMEDASVTALVWPHDDTFSISDRAAKLRRAHVKIGALLDTIDANVR